MTEFDPDGPVERYLDRLFDRLAGGGAAGRRALAEAEDHLRTGVAEAVANGVPRDEAERDAVRRFGDPAAIAHGVRLASEGVAGVLRRTFSGAWLVGAAACLALGVSGVASEVLGRVFGAGFVAGDPSGVTYTPARCADYFEYFPHAKDCATAAAEHHWGEVVQGRVAAGVLGLLALGAYALARRITLMSRQGWTPPSGTLTVVLAALFAPVGALLTLRAVGQLAFGDASGVGVNLADGLVALAAAAVIGLRGLRRVRTRGA
jgi:HAAS domain-containing protein